MSENEMSDIEYAESGQAKQDLYDALMLAQKDNAALRSELADTKDDYLRVHKDAVDCFEEIISLRSRLESIERETVERCAKVADFWFDNDSKMARHYADTGGKGSAQAEAVASAGRAAHIALCIRAQKNPTIPPGPPDPPKGYPKDKVA